MTRQLAVDVSQKVISEFCRKHRIKALWLFGSVLGDRFGAESDIDVMVEFVAGARPSLRDLISMEEELASILGRKVDLVERDAVERSRNYIRRKSILSSLEPLYVA